MSGKPNMPDIASLHRALAAVAEEEGVIYRAQGERSKANRLIEGAEERKAEALKKVNELMAAMDCASPGNTGYQARLSALLSGLSRHAEDYGRAHP